MGHYSKNTLKCLSFNNFSKDGAFWFYFVLFVK